MQNTTCFLLFILFLFATINIHAQDFENFDLGDYRWENRVLLIFSPNTFNSEYRNQYKAIQKSSKGIKERDLEVFYALGQSSASAKGQILPSEAVQGLRNQFDVADSEFTTLLIGKDGTEKLRSEEAISAQKLFEEIDAMPMRKLEMKNDGKD